MRQGLRIISVLQNEQTPGSISPYMQWVLKVLYLSAKRPRCEVGFQLAPKLRINVFCLGSYMPPWCAQGQYYFTFTLKSHKRIHIIRIVDMNFDGVLISDNDGPRWYLCSSQLLYGSQRYICYIICYISMCFICLCVLWFICLTYFIFNCC